MSKERLIAFTDAVLAIIMTILVLELEKPNPVSPQGLWELRENYFSYILSFFWLGLMWYNHHNSWQQVKTINKKTVFLTLVMLFFASLFPYTTSIVASNFNNETAQVMYGVVAILVTFSNVGISQSLKQEDGGPNLGFSYNKYIVIDIAIKALGFILTVTVFPPAMTISILVSMIFISVLPLKKKRT